ncbi:pyrroline-5-carboxylate reductase [Actinomyces sp. oral taxon 448]|jgi:pyrroline-5-carboxylate reductase|uniref:pyrroline-5-carboxylate reductase n=1 Tax=Actinomyces sp. oral taxon 448 TaxID=712124 RepID=UPI0002188AA4|nr:pyrroline-5-carboxylate reductase [Actinomyces sp. oral taxon 448]EGQ74093.1 pyrroline-5-carboxylate reductase [Actinomyces sp. oral taxon 448 str. F0400]
MRTYGFIGAGSMADAIIRGAVASGVRAQDLAITSAHDSARRLAERTGAVHLENSAALARQCDAVVLAVKPHVVPDVLVQIHDAVAAHRPLVVSIAAGVTLERIESLLPSGTRVVRAMPNMAAAAGESMTALAAGRSATREDLEDVRRLMSAVGRTVTMAEKNFSAFVGLAGSSPAFVLTFIEALARAGVMDGIPKAQAVEIVTQAVLGSARIVQVEETRRADGAAGRTPADLIDAVCSPGGTTVAGVVAMERSGFSSAVIDAFEATVARDRELGA